MTELEACENKHHVQHRLAGMAGDKLVRRYHERI